MFQQKPRDARQVFCKFFFLRERKIIAAMKHLLIFLIILMMMMIKITEATLGHQSVELLLLPRFNQNLIRFAGYHQRPQIQLEENSLNSSMTLFLCHSIHKMIEWERNDDELDMMDGNDVIDDFMEEDVLLFNHVFNLKSTEPLWFDRNFGTRSAASKTAQLPFQSIPKGLEFVMQPSLSSHHQQIPAYQIMHLKALSMNQKNIPERSLDRFICHEIQVATRSLVGARPGPYKFYARLNNHPITAYVEIDLLPARREPTRALNVVPMGIPPLYNERKAAQLYNQVIESFENDDLSMLAYLYIVARGNMRWGIGQTCTQAACAACSLFFPHMVRFGAQRYNLYISRIWSALCALSTLPTYAATVRSKDAMQLARDILRARIKPEIIEILNSIRLPNDKQRLIAILEHLSVDCSNLKKLLIPVRRTATRPTKLSSRNSRQISPQRVAIRLYAQDSYPSHTSQYPASSFGWHSPSWSDGSSSSSSISSTTSQMNAQIKH